MPRRKKEGVKQKVPANLPSSPPSNFAGKAWAAVGLVLLAALPYLNALRNGFVYDDRLQVLENPYVHSARYLGRILGGTLWTFQGAQGITNYYRPVQVLSYLVLYQIFGPSPMYFHLLNLLLHVGVVLLLFAVTMALFGDGTLAFFSAALFAIHPIHTESVVWIADLTDMELCFFFLLTFLLYVRIPPHNSRRWVWQAAMLASYVCALLSKEPAMVFPLLAAAYEHFYRPGRESVSLRAKVARYAPFCVLVIAYVGFRRFVLSAFAPQVSRTDLGWSRVLLSAVALAGGYLEKLIWPAHLSAFYVFHAAQHVYDPAVLGGLAGLSVCLVLFVWFWRRAHMVSFAFLWMGATLGPVLNARWMTGGVFAERYLYLPSVGFCWIAGWLMATVWDWAWTGNADFKYPPKRIAACAAAGALLFVCGVAVLRRNRDWRTDEILYRRTLEEQPDAQLIRTNLGLVYWDNGDALGAEREWVRAMGPEPPYVSTLDNLGLLRTVQERYPEAISLFERAIQDNPAYAPAHKNLAAVYADMGRVGDADREFRTAVALAPLNTEARNAYGHFLADQGRSAEAGEQFRASVNADDNDEAQESLQKLSGNPH